MSKDRVKLTLVRARTDTRAPLPLASSGIHAGFPSPAENFIEESIDLNKRLIKDPEATFYAWVEGVMPGNITFVLPKDKSYTAYCNADLFGKIVGQAKF